MPHVCYHIMTSPGPVQHKTYLLLFFWCANGLQSTTVCYLWFVACQIAASFARKMRHFFCSTCLSVDGRRHVLRLAATTDFVSLHSKCVFVTTTNGLLLFWRRKHRFTATIFAFVVDLKILWGNAKNNFVAATQLPASRRYCSDKTDLQSKLQPQSFVCFIA